MNEPSSARDAIDSFHLFLTQRSLKLGSSAIAWKIALPAIAKIAHKTTLSNMVRSINGCFNICPLALISRLWSLPTFVMDSGIANRN